MAQYYPKSGVCYEHAERSKIYMIYNFVCNAKCDHCLVQASPRRREKLSPETAKEILRLGAEHGKSFLDLSGGEIMVFRREVYDIASTARDLGYFVCMNTNGFWASSPERAKRIVAQLQESGVQAIFPSASAYHLDYVPLQRVKNVRAACDELGVTHELNWVTSDRPEVDAWMRKELGIEDETVYFDALTLNGNDPATIERLKTIYRTRTPDEIDDCFSVHLGVNPRGHVVTTCNMTNRNEKYRGTPFFLGNFYETPFEEILKAERESAVLQFIYDNPHPALHRLLSEDDEIGEYHRETFSERRYYGIIDYYVDLFRDERTMSWIDRRLPDVVAAQRAQPIGS